MPDLAGPEALVCAGKAAEAFALLESCEFDRSGIPNFDHCYGDAARESAHPDKATLALERALAVNPDYVAARLDLARGYCALGDLERARIDFGVVLAQNPPPLAKLTIERSIGEIDRRTQARSV